MHKSFLYLILCSVLVISSCTKDRDTDVTLNPIATEGDYFVLHIWDFNQESSPEGLLEPAFSFDFARLNIQASRWDEVDGTDINSFDNSTSGNALRVRNPSEYMDIQFSTKGYGDIRISYACMRTGSGAKTQIVSYANDGVNFSDYSLQDSMFEILEDWHRFEINMQNIPALSNKDLVVVRIAFADGNAGSSGNNRFDNIRIEGRKLSN
jgi:hypothetical protein